ncbi:MAG: PilZ domain-containing protein [Proteobacteria bacterium]|nr:PilZ domain-containing protein [Pseudomonadota bacterium]
MGHMGDSMMNDGAFRHARMPLRSAAMLIRGAEAWPTEIADISATGVLLARPADWQGRLGDLYALDMIVGDELNIHVEATLARMTRQHLGFAYARIPPEKEVPLWNLLGGFADKLEPFDD